MTLSKSIRIEKRIKMISDITASIILALLFVGLIASFYLLALTITTI